MQAGPDYRTPGQKATTPWSIPLREWVDIALRSWREAGQDNISLVSSGVAFCAILAMVPTLAAIVLSYGLVATPATVTESVQSLTSMMPVDAARLIGEQLANVVKGSDGKKGFGLLLALGVALYGAMKGSSAVITSLNIAYDENESRSFLKLYAIALAIALGGVAVAVLAIAAIAAMTALETVIPNAPTGLLIIGKITSYILVAVVGISLAAVVYRFGPDRKKARWVWLTPGSLFASLSWMIITFGFGIYVANFGSYDATYGSLGAAIVLLTWLYLSAYVLLLGAEFNCELERQTTRDTTEGVEKPLGQRGAFAADTVAEGPHPDPKPGPGPQSASASPQQDLALAPEAAISPKSLPIKGLVAGRVIARVNRTAGLGTVDIISSLLATGGLRLLRKRRRTAIGAAMLVAAGGLSWKNGSNEE